MKKIVLLVALMLLVAAPAFAQEIKPGQAFNYFIIGIPGPGTPIQLTGGKDTSGPSLAGSNPNPSAKPGEIQPGQAFNFFLGNVIPGPGTPIYFTGGKSPAGL